MKDSNRENVLKRAAGGGIAAVTVFGEWASEGNAKAKASSR